MVFKEILPELKKLYSEYGELNKQYLKHSKIINTKHAEIAIVNNEKFRKLIDMFLNDSVANANVPEYIVHNTINMLKNKIEELKTELNK